MAFEESKNKKYSVGLLMHLLWDVHKLFNCDEWQFGDGQIKRFDTTIGSYAWNDDGTSALFSFVDPVLNERYIQSTRETGLMPKINDLSSYDEEVLSDMKDTMSPW